MLKRCHRGSGLDHAVALVEMVCRLAGLPSFVDDGRAELNAAGVIEAVRDHDTGTLFNWLVGIMSFQGISNGVAASYMAKHGRATWHDIDSSLVVAPACPKLTSYWHFHRCNYRKGAGTCAEPNLMAACPLPRLPLRNGRLNQGAYSLYLFIRDVADRDLVAWIDDTLADADDPAAPDRLARLRRSLVEPLRNIHGVSDKVLTMVLSSLLLGAGEGRPLWTEVGGVMIAVDTLIHNFLVRTGILRRLHADHPYGPGCYRPGGCADIIEEIAGRIDASRFNPEFPPTFPRFVQHAVWRYCAQNGLNVCNGNRVDDRIGCKNVYCRIYAVCDRLPAYGGQKNGG
jgi:hypothetical protein